MNPIQVGVAIIGAGMAAHRAVRDLTDSVEGWPEAQRVDKKMEST